MGPRLNQVISRVLVVQEHEEVRAPADRQEWGKDGEESKARKTTKKKKKKKERRRMNHTSNKATNQSSRNVDAEYVTTEE